MDFEENNLGQNKFQQAYKETPLQYNTQLQHLIYQKFYLVTIMKQKNMEHIMKCWNTMLELGVQTQANPDNKCYINFYYC